MSDPQAMRTELDSLYRAMDAAQTAGAKIDPAVAKELVTRARTLEYQLGRMEDTEEQRINQRGFGAAVRDVLPLGGLLTAEGRANPAQAIPGEALVRVGKGAQQLATAAGEMTGSPFVEQGATADMTAIEDMRRDAWNEGSYSREQVADVGEMGILFTTPISTARRVGMLKALKETQSFGQAFKRGAKSGAIAGAAGTGFAEGAEDPGDVIGMRALGAAIGGTIGGVLTGVASWLPTKRKPEPPKGTKEHDAWVKATPKDGEEVVGPALGNLFYDLKRGAQTNVANLAERQRMWKMGELSIGQQGGNTIARSLEMQVGATRAQNFFIRQYERFAAKSMALVRGMGAEARKANPGRDAKFMPSSLDTALSAGKAYNKVRDETIKAANTKYGAEVRQALSLAAEDPAKFPIPFENAASTVSRWADQTGEPWWRIVHPGANKMAPEFKMLDDYLRGLAERNKLLNNPPGGFNPPRIGEVMEGMGIEQMVLFRRALNTADAGYWAAKRGSQEITPALNQMHRAVSELQAAFDKDISGFIAKNASDRPAVQALRTLADANKDHTKFWKLQHEVEQTTLANTLGINAGIDPEQTLLQIARMEPRQQRELAMVLQAQSPGALADLRLLLVNNAVQDAVSGSTRAARHGLVDPEAFGKAILDKHGNVFGSEIFTPAQYAQLQRGLSTIRVLKDGAFGTENVNRALSLEGTGMAGASGSVAFLTRAMIRIFGLGRAEELLFTKEGLRSLEVLRNSSKEPPQAISKALAKIIDLAALNPERPDPYLDTSE